MKRSPKDRVAGYDQLREFYKSKTPLKLFEIALEENYCDDQPWCAVSELRTLGTPEIFEMAKEWCKSSDARRRVVGLDVLSQLGNKVGSPKGIHLDERVSIALDHVADVDPDVVKSAAYALAHCASNSDEAVSALIELRNNEDSGVRHAVAFGLGGQSRPEAIETLVKLMDDKDDEVRNWATFGLGFETTGDTRQIREALQKRLNDPFEEVRQEAVWALALRRDPQGLELLVERLQSEAWVDGDKTTAAEILDLAYADGTSVEELCSSLRKVPSTVI